MVYVYVFMFLFLNHIYDHVHVCIFICETSSCELKQASQEQQKAATKKTYCKYLPNKSRKSVKQKFSPTKKNPTQSKRRMEFFVDIVILRVFFSRWWGSFFVLFLLRGAHNLQGEKG